MSDPQARLASALADRYRIEREIGAGGMATVYLAHDIKHDRKVAIKVLRPELGMMIGADRFLSEIRTTANLQHPNILPLFDSGVATVTTDDSLTTADSRLTTALLFYVMPFVDGESLRSRIAREKQLPITDAVRITTEVAGALDYAHRHNVIHRDIKPENILLHDGRAMVADFGIALAAGQAGARMTETGMSLGTPHYMSPEQAMGERNLTGRSDVYALGCVTYEMLTGDPPFTGSTVQAIIARVVTEHPRALTQQRHTIPLNVEAAVLTAIEKLPADRFGTAAEFASALNNTTFTHRTPRSIAATGASLSRSHVITSSRLAGAAVAGAAVLALGIVSWTMLRPAAATLAPTARLVIPLPADRMLAVDPRPFDISPGGTDIVYVGDVDGQSQLFLRPLDDFEARAIPGTEGAHQPFFSPDGKWIGFVADGKLEKIPLAGGAPITLTTVTTSLRGASWGSNGTILYSYRDSLFLIPDQGGTPSGIHLSSRAASNTVRWPRFLPDGKHALISTDTAVEIVDLKSGDMHPLVRGRQATYLPDGHLLFDEAEGRMRVVPFDVGRMMITGSPVPAFEAFRGPGSSGTQYAVSANGTLVYVAGGFNRTLVMVDRNGHETPLALPPRGYRLPKFSPDGERLAVTIDPRPSQIWVVDLKRMSAVPVTTEGHNLGAVWSPDGSRLVFGTGATPLWVGWPQGGAGQPALEAKLRLGAAIYPGSWSPRIGIIATSLDTSGTHVVSFHLGDSVPTRVTSGPAREWQPSASPDERWVAFTSSVSGADEVYVRSLTGVGGAIRVSTNGGGDPLWAADGKSLYYRRGSRIMVAGVATKEGFQVVGEPRELLAGTWDFSQQDNWDVAPDGRFIMVRGDPASSGRLLVVVNWFDELKKKS